MALVGVPKDTWETVQAWLDDAKAEALEDDPSVGLYKDEYLAIAFGMLQAYVEEETGVGHE